MSIKPKNSLPTSLLCGLGLLGFKWTDQCFGNNKGGILVHYNGKKIWEGNGAPRPEAHQGVSWKLAVEKDGSPAKNELKVQFRVGADGGHQMLAREGVFMAFPNWKVGNSGSASFAFGEILANGT